MKTFSFLVIDLGTQSLRVSVMNSIGEALWRWSKPVESTIEGDVFVQSTEHWRELINEALAEVGRTGIRPDALTVAAPLAGFVALSQDGEALTPAIMYSDRRSASYLDMVETAVKAVPDANPYGLRAYVPDPLPHFLRLRDQSPEVYARTRRLLDATGWINWYLTGSCTLNSYTALRLYSSLVRKSLGVPEGIFGEPIAIGVPIGNMRGELSERFGLPPIPVIGATFDSKSAYIGSGIREPGDALDISGTVTSFGVVSTLPVRDPERRVYAVPFGPDSFLARGSTASSGGTLEWARKELLSEDFNAIDDAVGKTKARVDGPIFLPYLAGERSPLWNPHARGALLGLSLDASNHAQLARAIYEGLALSLRHIVDILSIQGVHTKRIFIAGGLSQNDTLCQIKADVLGIPLTRYQNIELTTIGLCVIAGMALETWPDRSYVDQVYAKVDRVFILDKSEHTTHTVNFHRYKNFVSALKPTFAPTGGET